MKKIILKIKDKINRGPALYRRPQPSGAGFVILFAVTISAILLSIAIGVTNIAFREVKFSTSVKSSNDAFFAADAGIECAMLYDKSDQDKNIFPGNGATISMNCAGRTFTPTLISPSLWTFFVSGLGSISQSCAIVTVDKTSSLIAKITSKGYNNGGGVGTCTPGLNTVEREIVITYDTSGTSDTFDLNFDFENGTVGFCPDNWNCIGDAMTSSSSDGQGCVIASNINGSQYLKAGCDSTIGTAKSQNFILPSNIDHVRALRAGGADGPDSGWFVKRFSDDAILCSAISNTDSDTFFTDDCASLGSYAGTSVYIHVIDNINSGWGKTYLDNIRLMDASDNILLPI
jgi:hypothetical protein